MRSQETNSLEPKPTTSTRTRKLLYVGKHGKAFCADMVALDYIGLCLENSSKASQWLDHKSGDELPDAIICDKKLPDGDAFAFFSNLKQQEALKNIPFIIVSDTCSKEEKKAAMQLGVDDFYALPCEAEGIHERLNFIIDFKRRMDDYKEDEEVLYTNRLPFIKRAFDIAFSLTLLLLLSPIFLIIALIIKLESRGAVFYTAKRAGTGYQVFDFYKFRSMRQGADAELKNLLSKNQYANGGSPFVKISNDPRITRFGHFLRNTSIDELPQLFNVLKGDMSIVGNRPLPLYEAEQLTTDMWAKRFLAPAGITGLWQVTKRGKKEMSETERKQLDIAYASDYSFWMDCKIILKTFPALIQKESV
jgi:lipopolysaccharide/colanic/teichoic acid biosynthesis glycosyltransferase